MAQLLADENFPLAVVEHLRQQGHNVLTMFDVGLANQRVDDAAVLDFAHSQKRALLTLNRRDFIRLHREQPVHSGIIACTEDGDSSGQANRIDQAIQAADSLDGMLIRIYRPA